MKSSTKGGLAVCFIALLYFGLIALVASSETSGKNLYLVCRDKSGSCFAVLNGRQATFAPGDTVAVAKNAGGLYLPGTADNQYAQMIVVR